jgi:hypothetical protein
LKFSLAVQMSRGRFVIAAPVDSKFAPDSKLS